MQTFDVYEDIAKRTGGDIYIGVVGPVRTGKSTLIRQLLSQLVIPNIPSSSSRSVATDEIPQSSDGKTVMTTEPKFVPGEAVRVRISDQAEANIRMIDCVGFAVEGANGFEEDGKPRTVMTPWSDAPLPFEEAAALGTERVIREHSTIGILVTTDGSFTGIARAAYEAAEARTVAELKRIGKPFVIVLNTAFPLSEETEALRARLEETYGCSVLSLDLIHLSEPEIGEILQAVLFEFPLRRVDFSLPGWMQVLPAESEVIAEVLASVRALAPSLTRLKDCKAIGEVFSDAAKWKCAPISLLPAEGRAECRAEAQDGVFFGILSRECGEAIADESKLMAYVKQLSESKRRFDGIKSALAQAEECGYGVVLPVPEEISLSEPRLVRNGPYYGAGIRATGAGYHIVKVEVTGEVSQILGTQAQGESFVGDLKSAYEGGTLPSVDVFGKSVRTLVTEELNRKMGSMSAEAQRRIRRALKRVVNDGKNNVICLVF